MRAVNAGQALAMVLVDELVRCGVRHACLAPGSRSTPLALALADHTGIQTHVIIDERSAAFSALGIAKATGVAAVVACTSGTATANLYPAVIEADQSRTPLIVLTADRPPELRHTGANQTIDQVKLYGGAVRWFVEVGAPESRPGSVRSWRSTASRAWADATGSPPGPVHMNLAFRDPLVPVPDEAGFPFALDGRPGQAPWTEVTRARALPEEAVLRRLADEISSTQRGLMIAGAPPGGPGWRGYGRGLAGAAALARNAGWPLLADPLSGLRRAGTVSAYEALLRHDGFTRAMRPDLVVRVGALGTSKSLAAYLDPGIRQVLIDPDGSWSDPERATAWLLQADPADTSAALAEAVRLRDASPWLEAWLRAEHLARAAVDRALDGEEAASEPRAARDVAACVPAGGLLVAASSMPVRDLEWFMAPRPDKMGLAVLAHRGASGIDGFVSTVLGAALTGRGPVVALGGDLSMLHDQNGLLAVRKGDVSAVFVVVNNDGGGIFSFLPQAKHASQFERLFGTPQDVSFRAVAELYGCSHLCVARARDLAPAVLGALDAGGVHLVEIRTERPANEALHRRLWQAVETSLQAGGWP